MTFAITVLFQEREFSLEISTENLKPDILDLYGVFVIYEWEWKMKVLCMVM